MIKTMPISETESAYKPIIYGQQTPIGSGQKEPSITDYSELKQYNTALSQINNNMNQIARKANTYDLATKEDIKKVKEMMDELWHIQRSILSKQPLTRQ